MEALTGHDRSRAGRRRHRRFSARARPVAGERPGTGATAELVAAAYADELLVGYAMDPAEILGESLSSDAARRVVALRDIETSIMCPHHLMPASGVVHVAYAPRDRIVGLGRARTPDDLLLAPPDPARNAGAVDRGRIGRCTSAHAARAAWRSYRRRVSPRAASAATSARAITTATAGEMRDGQAAARRVRRGDHVQPRLDRGSTNPIKISIRWPMRRFFVSQVVAVVIVRR